MLGAVQMLVATLTQHAWDSPPQPPHIPDAHVAGGDTPDGPHSAPAPTQMEPNAPLYTQQPPPAQTLLRQHGLPG